MIVELDGAPVEDAADLQRMMVAELIGTPVRLRRCARPSELELELTPAELELDRR